MSNADAPARVRSRLLKAREFVPIREGNPEISPSLETPLHAPLSACRRLSVQHSVNSLVMNIALTIFRRLVLMPSPDFVSQALEARELVSGRERDPEVAAIAAHAGG
jgi:hypothetical protein